MDNKVKQTPEKLIESLRMLDAEYIPDKIISRKEIFIPAFETILDAIRNGDDIDIVLYGPPGYGKYTFAIDLKNQLNKFVEDSRKTFLTAIIDFNEHSTRTQILSEILRQIDPENPAIKGKKYSSYPENILNECIASNDIVFFIIFKNINQMEDDYILHYFTHFNEYRYEDMESLRLKSSSIITFALSYNYTWEEYLTPTVSSRYRPARYYLSYLSQNELYEMLKGRVESLSDKILDDKLIVKCAEEGAELGDADFAVELLRSSILIAEKSHSDYVTLEHFEMAFREDEIKVATSYLSSFSKNEKLILNSILEMLENEDYITTGDVYRHYLTQCERLCIKPISTMETFSTNISSLKAERLIQTQMIYRGRKGNTRQITIEIPNQDIWREAMRKVIFYQFQSA